MDAHEVLLVTVLCIGVAGPVAQAQDQVAAAEAARATGPAKPWKHVRGFGRVLNLSNPPVIIDQPGLYAIDRNWQIPQSATAANPELIRITAEGVTLDLHGFRISAEVSAPPSSTLIAITGGGAAGVEIRNGALSACCEGGTTVHSMGTQTRLHHLSMFSHETIMFEADGALLTDSQVSPRVGISFTGGSTLERNTLDCNRGTCVTLLGDGNRIADNELTLYQGAGIAIGGDRNIVAHNVVDVNDAVDAGEAFEVAGDTNVVRGNTVLLGGVAQTSFVISGTANTLDGNIVAPANRTERAPLGMVFNGVGNFYGDNRMAAQTPFVGGMGQTDWGGNVGY